MSYELFESLDEGDIDTAKKLISEGEDIYRITENDKWSYLHIILTEMVEKTPIESIRFLIDQGLDVNAIDSGGYTPLLYAVRQRNVEGIRLLLENGADKLIENENQDGVSALRMVFLNKPNNYDIVKLLLEFGASPDTKNKNGKTVRERLQVIINVDPKIYELFEQY